jgi:hypothetical protein
MTVAITPGWLRSEMMLDNYGVSEGNWRDALGDRGGSKPQAPPDFALSESHRYVGRAVADLTADPNRQRWNQRSITSGELAHEYGFTDIDGTQSDIWRYMSDVGDHGKQVDVSNTARILQKIFPMSIGAGSQPAGRRQDWSFLYARSSPYLLHTRQPKLGDQLRPAWTPAQQLQTWSQWLVCRAKSRRIRHGPKKSPQGGGQARGTKWGPPVGRPQ